jgi:hypothetical protein
MPQSSLRLLEVHVVSEIKRLRRRRSDRFDEIRRLHSRPPVVGVNECNGELVLKNSVRRRVFPQGSFFRFVFFLR